MATTAKKLFDPVLLGTTAAVFYVTPSNTKCVIKKLTFTSTDASGQNVTLYLVKSGGGPSTANVLINAYSIGPGQNYEAYEAEGHTLNAGDTIQAFATATTINIQASGVEIV